jgi:cytochrome oxidase assembly protein ShyY1
MLRLALTPRWIVAAVVLVLFMVLAAFLGRWQWDRTQTILAAERAAASAAIPVQDVLVDGDGRAIDEVPDEALGRPVTAVGAYEPTMHAAVPNRELGGTAGVWIVDGLRLADGRVVAVLRGWLPTADSAGSQPPAGPVTVTGVLQPDEGFYAGAVEAPGTVAAIAHDRLGALWRTALLPGFVTLTSQEPTSTPAPRPVPPTVQTADVPFPLQNFFYAFQWWVFALFGLGVYLRWLWLESRRPHEEPSAAAAEQPPAR